MTFRARRDREVAQTVADAVTAWMKVDAKEKPDRRRRAAAIFHGLSPLWLGPLPALEKVADGLLAEIKSGRFDFDDAGHARAIAKKAAERLRQMVAEVNAMRNELREAIEPSTERNAAA